MLTTNSPTKVRVLIQRIVMSAVLTAMSVVLCRFLGFSPGGTAFRVEIGFLPIAAVAMMYGPVWAGVSYGVSDLLGAAITTGINPFITLCKVLFGTLLGLCFYGKKRGFIYQTVFFILVGAAVDILCMTPIFVHYFGYTTDAALITRAATAAINTPVRIALFYLTQKGLGDKILKYSTKTAEK